MDGSLSRMRGKADFRLMRELLGLPQEWVAKRVGVDARTVPQLGEPEVFLPAEARGMGPGGGPVAGGADAKAARATAEIASSAARVARERGVEPWRRSCWRTGGTRPSGDEGPSGGRGCGHVADRERGGAPGRGPAARDGPAGRDRVRGARGVTDTVGVI